MNINVAKREIIRALFIDTADDNYIVARWSYINNLNIDFFWLSVHALEKYMKATLLLNGESAKGFNHNICKLYERIQSLASKLLPTELLKPEQFEFNNWLNEKPADFISRLYQNGNPDNRYQIYGHFLKPGDLNKLDMMLFSLRRICVPLDSSISKSTELTHRFKLIERPKCWKLGSQHRLEKIINKQGTDLQRVLLNWNYSFAPDEYVHPASKTGFSGHNSVLVHFILDPLEQSSDRESIEAAMQLNKWVLDNIRFSKEAEKQLKQAMNPLSR